MMFANCIDEIMRWQFEKNPIIFAFICRSDFHYRSAIISKMRVKQYCKANICDWTEYGMF